jgi:aspartate/methionine/tyrosine aminotransferase
MKYRLTKAANNLEGQPMFKLLAKVKDMERMGQDIVHFEIGDPDFNTPENITNAAIEALKRGETHYQSSYGMTEFRELVREATLNSRGFKPDLDQVLIAPSANIIIYYAVACLVEAGDEVIVPDPCFPTYTSVLKYCGVKAVGVPLFEKNHFRMDPGDVEKAITEKTRMIILNSPHNPTGSVMTPEEIDKIAEIAEKHDIYLYSDEIYSRMIFDGTDKFHTPAKRDQCKQRTILANGFSKAFAMTGWRLGVCIAPKDVIEKMALLLQTTSSCTSPFIQRAGMEAISGSQDAVNAMMKEYKIRRDLLVDGLNKIPGITCLTPGGAFYVVPNITGTKMNSEEFAKFALEQAKVSLLPLTNFGPSGEGYVRLCYATSQERIKEGLRRLELALKEKQ